MNRFGRIRKYVGVLMFCCLAGLSSVAEDSGEQAQIQQQLTEARQRLDEAAHRFAELTEERMKLFHGEHDAGQWHVNTESRGRKATLGIMLNPLSQQEGVVLLGVTPGSGAEQSGLQAGDVILDINGTSLKGLSGAKAISALTKSLKGLEPGAVINIGFNRDKVYNTLDVTASKPRHVLMSMIRELDVENLKKKLESVNFGGLSDYALQSFTANNQGLRLFDVDTKLGSYFGVDSGVLVLSAPKNSGLLPGDIVQKIGGEAAVNVSSVLHKILSGDEQSEVEVLRDGSPNLVTLRGFDLTVGSAWDFKDGNHRLHVIKLDDDDRADEDRQSEIEILLQEDKPVSD